MPCNLVLRALCCMPQPKGEKLSSNSESEAAYKARMDGFVEDMVVRAVPFIESCSSSDVRFACLAT